MTSTLGRSWSRCGLLAAATALLLCTSVAEAKKPPERPLGTEDPTKVYKDPKEPPVELIPQEPAPGEVTPMYQTNARYTINPANSAPWASARNSHQQFFIGSVADGDTLNAYGGFDKNSRVGHIPNQGFCGWILSENLDPIGGTVDQPCPWEWFLNPQDFSQYINCDHCNGGWDVSLAHGTTLHRNVHPWRLPTLPEDPSIYRPAGYVVYWRYVSEDGNWVAVSDPNVSHLKWFFVPKSALPNICAAGPTPSVHPGWGLSCKH